MNQSKLSASLRSGLLPALSLLICLIFVEVPFWLALKAVLAISVQVSAGVSLYRYFVQPRNPSPLEQLVLGGALGIAFSTICDMSLRTTIGFDFGWALPACVVVLFRILANSNTSTEPIIGRPRDRFTSLLPIISIAFLYLAQDSVWPLWLFLGGACIYTALCLPRGSLLSRIRLPLVIITGISIFMSVNNRPPFWWYITDDFRVFESLSISITKFGANNPMGALGTLGMEYHFMTYSFSGMIDAIIGAPTFLVLSQLMPMLSAIMLSAIVWLFIERDGGIKKLPNFVLAAMFPLFFDYSFTSPSYCFGLFFYLVALFFWTDSQASAKWLLRIPINILLTIFIVTTKVSNLPTVLTGLACVAGFGIIRRKEWRLTATINFLSSTATALLYFIFFLANSRSGSQLSSAYPFGFAQRIAGDISTVDDQPTRVLVGLLVTSIFLVLPILGSILFIIQKRSTSPMFICFLITAVPLMLITALFGGHASSGYFVLSSLNILNIALIISLSSFFAESNILEVAKKRVWILISAMILVSYGIQALQVRSNGGGQNPILARALLSSHWIPSFFVALIWCLFQPKIRRNVKHLLLVATIIAELSFFAKISFQSRSQLTKGPELTQKQASIAIGAPDQIDVGIWIRKNVKPNALLASNYFCENACDGMNWFEDDFKLLDETYNFPPTPNGLGSFDMILPLYAERKFLIQGSRFLLVNGMDREEIRSRMKATLDFVNGPNALTHKALIDYGVSYFVVDTNATNCNSWIPFAEKIYANNSYIVLRLARSL
jgi:hypothetical protein